jgi:hypothetical protein
MLFSPRCLDYSTFLSRQVGSQRSVPLLSSFLSEPPFSPPRSPNHLNLYTQIITCLYVQETAWQAATIIPSLRCISETVQQYIKFKYKFIIEKSSSQKWQECRPRNDLVCRSRTQTVADCCRTCSLSVWLAACQQFLTRQQKTIDRPPWDPKCYLFWKAVVYHSIHVLKPIV